MRLVDHVLRSLPQCLFKTHILKCAANLLHFFYLLQVVSFCSKQVVHPFHGGNPRYVEHSEQLLCIRPAF